MSFFVRRYLKWFMPLTVIVLFAFCLRATALDAKENITDLKSLIDQEQLSIAVFLTPAEDISVGQKITLTVEVATTRWFAGGTRVGPLDIENIVVGPLNTFAINFSRREKGISWTVQHWTRDIFLLDAGSFILPEIMVDVTVAGEKGAVIKGRLLTNSLLLKAFLPQEMANVDQWLNAEQFSIETSFSSPLAELQVGDAIEQTITSRAEGVPAMMLPPPVELEIPGLGRYQSAPLLSDETNRGVTRSQRQDIITYVVEKEGRYILPSQEFHWWNNKRKRAEKVVFLEHEIYTSGSISQISARDKEKKVVPTEERIGVVKIGFSVGIILLVLGIIYLIGSNSHVKYKVQQVKHRRRIIKLWTTEKQSAALALFYNGLEGGCARDFMPPERVDALETVLRKAYHAKGFQMNSSEKEMDPKQLSAVFSQTVLLEKTAEPPSPLRSSSIRLN
ncbi:MAG: hypothetical protein ACI92E_002027 [Oceanicoccus sp.]|jgi:hypothetical protein